MSNSSVSSKWKCPKCQCHEYNTDTIATTGSGWSKIFDMQNRKFTAVACVIPLIIGIAVLLAALTHPNHLVRLSSWG